MLSLLDPVNKLTRFWKGYIQIFSEGFQPLQPFVLILITIGLLGLFSYLFLRLFMRTNLGKRFFKVLKKEGILYVIKVIRWRSLVFIHRAMKWKLIALRNRIIRRVLTPPELFKDRYFAEDNAEVVLYLQDDASSQLFYDHQPRKPLQQVDKSKYTARVSLIATLRNEAYNIEAWANSVFRQTRLPDEIVIADAGSTDGTVELLQKMARLSPVPFKVIVEPGANISKGRNVAIALAQFNIIATTDFGCRLAPDWLEKLIAPFETDPSIQVVAGMYHAIDNLGNQVERSGWWSEKGKINPISFLPSARSCAFTKEIWKTIGGYPEWLTLTGEDTYFALELKKYSTRWAFVPEAIVEWHAPNTVLAYWQKIYRWSIGDGESGAFAALHWKLVIQILYQFCLSILFFLFIVALTLVLKLTPVGLWIALALAASFLLIFILFSHNKSSVSRAIIEYGARISKILGFINGARRYKLIESRRAADIKGTFFILSGIPIDDTGGGARCTQIALELLRQKFAVVFIHKFPKYESVELNLTIRDSNLYSYQLSELELDEFVKEHGHLLEKPLIGVLVEMPIDQFIPVIKTLQKFNPVVTYDLLDEWDTALGGQWYSEQVEKDFINASQVLIATVDSLVQRLTQESHRPVHLLPNAVNTHLFNPDRFFVRPADLPDADWIAMYIGALWGEWFDWGLLVDLAKSHPEAAIVAIGDYRGQCPEKVPNLHFLGLKSQKDLPGYLAHADVAIIPWKVNKITQSTSPLKVYEYLAMRKPVVSPTIDPLKNIPGLYLAVDQNDFLDSVRKVKDQAFPVQAVSQFVTANNWRARVCQLIDWMQDIQEQGGSF